MLNPSYKRTHNSPIAKITLLSFLDSSQKISSAMSNYDKVSPIRNFSPTFSRNWSINSKKSVSKPRANRLITNKVGSPTSNTIDNYLTQVLQEFQIKNVDLDDSKLYFRKRHKKNAFDKFFGKNGNEEERKLVDYVRICEINYIT